MDSQKSFLETLPPKTAFVGGMITAVLALGTVGFVVLGSCLLSGSCGTGAAAPAAYAAPTAADTTAPADDQVGPLAAVTDKDHIRGDKNAPVTLIEYSDFQCPFCERFTPTVDQVMADYKGKVRLVYRHFPLSFHPEAEPAAEASECANEQGKFWEYHDKLFANQESLGTAYYPQLAKELGLNMTKFNDCLASDRMLAVVRAQYQGGATAGVNGTPGSFVVSKKGTVSPIRGALPYESVKPLIDAALAE